MASFLRRLPLLGLSLLFASATMAQMTQIEGVVKDENGQPLQNAVIKIERKDIKGNYNLKTKKKGDYLHAGLPLGTYKVSLEVNGQVMDTVDNVRTRLGEPQTINFDLQERKKKMQAMQKAAETGQLTQEQARDMTPEQRAALEKQVKERAAAMAKNKELNDAFNAGMEAMKTKQFDQAVASFTKAAELDPKQHVIFGQLAEAHSEISKTKTGPEKDAALAKSFENYEKAIALLPNDANYRNNYALALARAGKFQEMEQQLNQAVQLDPAGAGRYYFNLGAVLTNSGPTHADAACNAFKKATEVDANYADAWFQYGMCLVNKATAKPDGSMVFPEGTADALQKYLSIRPEGPNAESAKALLATMNTKLETQYVAPGAKKPAPAKRK
jgi:tetratricopeptide (TPR) repeat protein